MGKRRSSLRSRRCSKSSSPGSKNIEIGVMRSPKSGLEILSAETVDAMVKQIEDEKEKADAEKKAKAKAAAEAAAAAATI